MNKEFTIKIPDELYSSEFTQNKQLTLTYDGPSTLYVAVNPLEQAERVVTEDTPGAITLDAGKDTAAAYLISSTPDTADYQSVDEVLVDGTIYKAISNPSLHEYYTVKYTEKSGWELMPVLREPRTPGRMVAEGRVITIENIIARTTLPDTIFELAPEVLAALQAYKTELDTYISQEMPKKSWKYETYSSAPAVPELLKELLGG